MGFWYMVHHEIKCTTEKELGKRKLDRNEDCLREVRL